MFPLGIPPLLLRRISFVDVPNSLAQKTSAPRMTVFDSCSRISPHPGWDEQNSTIKHYPTAAAPGGDSNHNTHNTQLRV